MIIKNNKIKNSGLLYELLVRQITNDVINSKSSKALDVLKKYYTNSEISKEFRIYNSLNSVKNISESKANILISSAIEEYNKLDKSKLKKDKYNLISEMKKSYDMEDFFKTKVENYKILGSIYQLFECVNKNNGDINAITEKKMTILEHLTKSDEKEQDSLIEEFMSYDKGTRHLVYNIMVEKFNSSYTGLLKEQKLLLKEYINNISTNENVRKYFNNELGSVKVSITEITNNIDDLTRKTKLEELLSTIKEVPQNKTVSERDMNNLMYCYELINEFKQIK